MELSADIVRAVLAGTPSGCAADDDSEEEPAPMDRGAILEAMSALPVATRRQGVVQSATHGHYVGDLHRSWDHMQHARDGIAVRNVQRQLEQANESKAGMDKLWNKRALRHGDHTAGDGDEERAGIHPNTWAISTVVDQAWKCVNKDRLARDGIEGSHDHMAIPSVVAGGFGRTQLAWFEKALEGLHKGTALLLQRFFDATPMRLNFGSLAPRVSPHARYVIPSSDGTRWEVVDFEAYRSATGYRAARFGVLDVFHQTCFLHWQQPDGMLGGAEFLAKPVTLQRGNAACIHEAVEQAIPALSIRRLEDIY